MKRLIKECNVEIVIKGSRFLSEAMPAETPEAAREILRRKKAQYADATHVVHCFVTGAQGNVAGCSDDGEPAGTAGRPALEVLKNSGITNIMVTITRWFGGTKLGTGGLVRAYTQSVQEVLKVCETRELIPMAQQTFEIPYSLYEIVKRQLPEFGFLTTDEQFGNSVVISGELPASNADAFSAWLVEVRHR